MRKSAEELVRKKVDFANQRGRVGKKNCAERLEK